MTSLKQLFDLTGRVALITGGSRGLGLQMAEALGEFGARLVLAARKETELENAVGRLRNIAIEVDGMTADLGMPDSATSLVEKVMLRHRRLDILVNNAGTSWGAMAEDYPLEGWQKVFDLNVTGLFLLCQAAARRSFLPRGGGVILNVASIEGLRGHDARLPGTVGYNAAKGAVVNLTRALAAEWGPKGIRVNALAPGYFPSKMTGLVLERFGDTILAETPLGKLGGPHDLKGAALLLVSDAGGHITGQILAVDGGATVT